MKCEYHKNLESSHICADCGVSICRDCAVDDNGKTICLECAKKKGLPIIKNISYENNTNSYNSNNHYTDNHNRTNYQSSNVNYYGGRAPKKYSTFWSIIFSFLPGGGHMYLGLMKRGLQFMLLFFGTIALSGLIYSADFLIFFAVVVWFYSFFDCIHMRKRLEHGENVDEDLIFPIDTKNLNAKHLGMAFIILGGLVLLNELFDQLVYIANRMNIYSESVKVTIRLIRESIFPVVLIIIGFFLLKRTKNNVND
ncbi:hypothetical protein DW1_1059 [Proteiniborus sp. DW1]|uniref:hypothetical protein n=1 Tax=Proteiniborus sp. DW1 TaxID=1889883 RepID=UPI00092E1174|nr:hypothetical protein [Proteiniborus sp. DW1]SCG82655.1 hypothetical protein DW1_1059 [Proteiniborus sp. DW1]